MSDNSATFGQALHALFLIGQKKPTLESLKALYESGLLSDLLEADITRVDREALRKLLDLLPLEFKFDVDYDAPLNELISAGKYDFMRPGIAHEKFSLRTGRGKQEVVGKLFAFTNASVREVSKGGFRAANVQELLAFGAKFPDVQRRVCVLAMDAQVSDTIVPTNIPLPPLTEHFYAYLSYDPKKGRHFYLLNKEGLLEDCHLLAIRK